MKMIGQCQVPFLVHAAKRQQLSRINFRYFTYHEMSTTVNKCQVSYLGMLDTYSRYDYTQNSQVL